MRVKVYECEKCPDPVYNAIRVFGLIIIIAIFFVILVIINIRKKNESQMSVMFRILTNYLQLISTTLSYGFSYPSIIYDIFAPVEDAGTTSQSFLSFDCFFRDSNIVAFTPSTVLFKLFLSVLLPAGAIIGIILFWTIFRCTKHKWFMDTTRSIVVTIICFMFLLHPTLTNLSLTVFQCTNVGDGESRMTIDMEID